MSEKNLKWGKMSSRIDFPIPRRPKSVFSLGERPSRWENVVSLSVLRISCLRMLFSVDCLGGRVRVRWRETSFSGTKRKFFRPRLHQMCISVWVSSRQLGCSVRIKIFPFIFHPPPSGVAPSSPRQLLFGSTVPGCVRAVQGWVNLILSRWWC